MRCGTPRSVGSTPAPLRWAVCGFLALWQTSEAFSPYSVLAKDAHGVDVPRLHHGERIFCVASFLIRQSGLSMTIARLCRRVWASRHGYCDPPKMTFEPETVVMRLLGPVVPPANSS
jgi:hypothetical protein